MRTTTLLFLTRPGEILLALKKRGFGAGKWNGVGGKVNDGERVLDAAVREAREEIGVSVRPADADKRGVISFFFADRPEWNLLCHVFFTERFSGSPRESDEMMPRWYPLSEIPYREMWIDDPEWLPLALAGKRFAASFTFRDGGAILVSKDVTVLT